MLVELSYVHVFQRHGVKLPWNTKSKSGLNQQMLLLFASLPSGCPHTKVTLENPPYVLLCLEVIFVIADSFHRHVTAREFLYVGRLGYG